MMMRMVPVDGYNIDVDVDVDVDVGVDVDVDDDSLPQVEEPDFSILRQRHYRARFL